MEVYLNNKSVQVEEESTLTDLLEQSGFQLEKGIAVAVNNVVVPKKEHGAQRLKENDKILIIKATCGG